MSVASNLVAALAAIAGIPNAPAVAEYELDDLDEVLAVAYLRVSLDKSGRQRSNDEQYADAVATLERKRRWSMLDEVFVDVGSASKFARKRRHEFDELIRTLEAGTFRGHVLMVWEVSRSTRRVEEMKTLLALARWRGVYVYVIDDRRLCSPWSVSDWGWLMNAAVKAEEESMRTSQRTKRASNADAGNGRFVGGRRPFGYEADGVTIRQSEAVEIRAAVKRLLAGDPVRAIAADLKARGVRTPGTHANPTGNVWHPNALARVLGSPRIAGKRVHHGAVVGDAAWPGIIDEVTHRRVVAMLKTRTPVGRRGRTPWLLTGLLLCGKCGEPLVGNADAGTGTRRYACHKGPGYGGCGGLVVKADPVEETLAALVTDRLSGLDARRAADLGPDDDSERGELDRLAVVRVEIARQKIAGEITPKQAAIEAVEVERAERDIETRLAAKVRKVVPFDLVDDGRPWDELDLEERRRKLRAVIKSVTVGPATVRGSNRFELERITAPGRIDWHV